jgi:hypothetical protein
MMLIKADGSDWRSSNTERGPAESMLFFIESLRAFQMPLSQPREEITVCSLSPAQGNGVISLEETEDPKTASNLYLAQRAEGPFIKINESPIQTPGLRIMGLEDGIKYYLRYAQLDDLGKESPPGPAFGVDAYLSRNY